MADAETRSAPGWGSAPADAEPPAAGEPSDLVSREELRKVIAERDAYKRRLRQLQRQTEPPREDPPGIGPAVDAAPPEPARMREELLRRQIAEKDRLIARLLVDNQIAEAAARLGAFDPKAVVTLTRDLFTVKDGKVQLGDSLEDAGLTRFDAEGRERALADVVAEYLSKNSYLVRPSGAQGAGSRAPLAIPVATLQGMTAERYARLSPAEKAAVRRMAGVPERRRVW